MGTGGARGVHARPGAIPTLCWPLWNFTRIAELQVPYSRPYHSARRVRQGRGFNHCPALFPIPHPHEMQTVKLPHLKIFLLTRFSVYGLI